MDTRIIDVALGLVLVFAVASLLVTAVQEAWASANNTRGDTLMRAVTSLMGDNTVLARELLSHPLLVSMSADSNDDGKGRMPSYIPSDVAVTALLAYLTSRYVGGDRPNSPADFLVRLRANMPVSASKLQDSLASMVRGVEQDWPAYEKRLCAWFDAVGERSRGWFKRRTQKSLFFMSLALAVLLNINPIIIVDALWNDAALRDNMAAQADVALRAYQIESGAVVKSPAASGTVAVDVRPVATRLTGEVDNAVGRLRSAVEVDNTILKGHLFDGAGDMALVAMKAAQDLRPLLDKERRILSGPEGQRARGDAIGAFDARVETIAEALKRTPSVLSADGLKAATNHLELLRNAVEQERKARDDADFPPKRSAEELATLAQTCKAGPDAATHALCLRLEAMGAFTRDSVPIGWSWATWPRIAGLECPSGKVGEPARTCRAGDKNWFNNADVWSNLPFAIAGWLITAFAISLGAPFWFDILSKLIKVRGSGTPPVPARGSEQATPNVMASSAAPPVATAPAAPVSAPSDDAMSKPEKLMEPDDVVQIQRQLGLPSSAQSGRFDLTTRTAIMAWQKGRHVPATGILTAEEVARLLSGLTEEEDGYVG